MRKKIILSFKNAPKKKSTVKTLLLRKGLFSQSVTIIRSASSSHHNIPTFCLDSNCSHNTNTSQKDIKDDSGVPLYGWAQLLQLQPNLPGSSLLRSACATKTHRCTLQPELHPDVPKPFLLRVQIADIILMYFQVLQTCGEASGSAV